MAPGRKQGGGCWTCRLRRKRCDSVRPICGSCKDLEITCYSGEARPSWMDGGARQKHMSETIKGRVKQNALVRRERRALTHDNQGLIITETDHSFHTGAVPASALSAISHASGSIAAEVPSAGSIASTLSTSPVRQAALQSSTDQSEEFQPSLTPGSSTTSLFTLSTDFPSDSSWLGRVAAPIQRQLGSVMIYLDHVFPFLFPFYRPPLIETGRQWLLGLLCQNEVSFYIAASLSAYFFSLIPQTNEQDMHADCKALVRKQLIEQIDMAIRSLQSTVTAIDRCGAQSPLLDRIRVMQEIAQLLIVEVTVRRDANWDIHLSPALILFDEIFKSYNIDHSRSNLATLLRAIPSGFPAVMPHHKPLPNTPDQSAFVFFTSLLLFVDIVASTSLNAPPVLKNYHHSLLSSYDEGKCLIRLEAVVGCQNWALVAIGDISALCAWKRDAKHNGNFSVVELVGLAEPISRALSEGLNGLDAGNTHSQSNNASANWLEGYYSRHDRGVDDNSISNVTRIWAYAAKLYLSVSLSGWQANSPDIQANVARVLSLLQTIESPAQLRSLSWPIALAGCLAPPSQEHDFLCVVGVMGQLEEFGTISNALRIMAAVWISRDTIDRNNWDVAASLSILGSPALLL